MNKAYPDSEDLPKRLISSKILTDRAYEIAINSKYVGYQRELANMAHMVWQKNTIRIKCKWRASSRAIIQRRRDYARFKDNIWAADLSEMGSLSSKNRGIKHLLYFLDVLAKYVRVRPLKDKKAKAVLNCFIGLTDVDKLYTCICEVLEIISFTNCCTWLFCNNCAHKHTFSVSRVQEATVQN